MSKPSTIVSLFLISIACVGASYGCCAANGISIKDGVQEFWKTTVIPLWKYGPKPPARQPGERPPLVK